MFDLQTHYDQEFGEAYAFGFYDVHCLRDKWDRNFTVQEIETEREIAIVFDGFIGNPVMNMLKFNSENYEDDERTYIDKDGDEIVSSYRFSLVAHNSCRFDCWVVLNSLVKNTTDLKII